MSTYLPLCLAVLLLVACSRRSNAQPAELEKGGLLVDVRTAAEFSDGHLTNAINIPYEVIADRIKQHVKNKTDRIVLYCRSGHRAEIAKRTLVKEGYTEVANAGSYNKLKASDKKQAEAKE